MINKPRAMSSGTFPLVQGLKNIIDCGTPVKKKNPLPVHARLASCVSRATTPLSVSACNMRIFRTSKGPARHSTVWYGSATSDGNAQCWRSLCCAVVKVAWTCRGRDAGLRLVTYQRSLVRQQLSSRYLIATPTANHYLACPHRYRPPCRRRSWNACFRCTLAQQT